MLTCKMSFIVLFVEIFYILIFYRRLPNTIQIWCEICDIQCSTISMLHNHNKSTKHKNKLRKFNVFPSKDEEEFVIFYVSQPKSTMVQKGVIFNLLFNLSYYLIILSYYFYLLFYFILLFWTSVVFLSSSYIEITKLKLNLIFISFCPW